MKGLQIKLVCALAFLSFTIAFNRIKRPQTVGQEVGSGLPLVLDTAMETAENLREMAKVTELNSNITSYSGFLQVRSNPNSNMFFWYFPPQNGDLKAPNLIWLQGGPGASSLFGLFSEMGVFSLDKDLNLVERNSTWNKNYGMIFIDQPMGTGFSYTEADSGYCNNEEEVASDLYTGMSEFYKVFPDQLENDLYITGESYAGKYIPAFGKKIYEENLNQKVKLPLVGVSIGDGWTDPKNQTAAYPAMWYNLGLIDEKERKKVEEYNQRTFEAIDAKDYRKAQKIQNEMFLGENSYFHKCSGTNDVDNFMKTNAPESFNYPDSWAMLAKNKKALHVGNATYQDGSACWDHLIDDQYVSQVENLKVLMNNYKVLIYNGQLDIDCGASTTNAYLPYIDWKHQEELKQAEKKVWRINDSDLEVAGFVHEVKNFTKVMIRSAGHIAPYDQPWRCFDMIERFVENKPYKNLPNPVNNQK